MAKVTIEQLKSVKEFVIEEIDPTSPQNTIVSSYTFFYDKKEGKLYITGDVFGTEKYRVVNSLEVLFAIAKNREIAANIDKKFILKVTHYKH